MPCASRLPIGEAGDVGAIDGDGAAGDGAEPGDRFDEFRLAVALDAGDPEDFARGDGERDGVDGAFGPGAGDGDGGEAEAGGVGVGGGERGSDGGGRGLDDAIAGAGDDYLIGGAPRVDVSVSAAAGTSGTSAPIGIPLASSRTVRPTIAVAIAAGVVSDVRIVAHRRPVPHDGDAIGHLHQFVQLVRHQHDRRAAVAHRAQHLPQLSHFRRRQHRRRFIQNQQLRAAIQRLENLDALRFAHAQFRDQSRRLARQTRLTTDLRQRRLQQTSDRTSTPTSARGPSTTFSATVSVGTSMKC